MQNRQWLVAVLLRQQVHKSATHFREIAKLDDANGSLLLGNSLGLDLRLCDPHPSPRFQRKRTHINREGYVLNLVSDI